MPIDVTWADPLPPHFPQPNFDPIVHMEGVIAEKDEAIAMLYREARAWQLQLEAALMRISELEAQYERY